MRYLTPEGDSCAYPPLGLDLPPLTLDWAQNIIALPDPESLPGWLRELFEKRAGRGRR